MKLVKQDPPNTSRWDRNRYDGPRKIVSLRGTPMEVPQTLSRYVDKIVVKEDGCWEWTASVGEHGYGRVRFDNVEYRAHVFIYLIIFGVLDVGLVLGHQCHDTAVLRGECYGGISCAHRRCVNPTHLVPMTQRENMKRAAKVICRKCGAERVAQTNGRFRCRTCRKTEQTHEITCACGKTIQARSLSTHRRSCTV